MISTTDTHKVTLEYSAVQYSTLPAGCHPWVLEKSTATSVLVLCCSPVRNDSSSEDESLDSGDEEQQKLPSIERLAARKDGNNRSAGRRVGDCNSGGALSDDPEDSDAAEDEGGDRTKPARVTVTTSSGSSEAGSCG